jgi:hypothetical protein
MTPPSIWRRRGVRRIVVGLVAGSFVVAAALAVAMSPAVTRQGVDKQVSHRQLPLYVKIIDFVHRHEHYGLLVKEITAGLTTDRERAEAILAWTRRTIRPVPEGFPDVDDHVLDIIVRRYGFPGQVADVFTVLATYAGVPSYWDIVETGPFEGVYAYSRIDGQWLLADFMGDGGFTPPPRELAAVPPRPLRAELQMPGPRLFHEARQLIGW